MTATAARVLIEVPPPRCPEGEVLTGYLVEVIGGQYPSSWTFDPADLTDAVEQWANEGVERCGLWALAVRPTHMPDEPVELRATFGRLKETWSAWEDR